MKIEVEVRTIDCSLQQQIAHPTTRLKYAHSRLKIVRVRGTSRTTPVDCQMVAKRNPSPLKVPHPPICVDYPRGRKCNLLRCRHGFAILVYIIVSTTSPPEAGGTRLVL